MDFSKVTRKLKALSDYMVSLEIPVHAAHACYFIVLAVVPFLLLILSLLRYTDVGSGQLLEVLQAVIPAALMPTVGRLVESVYATSSMAVVSVSAVAALWAVSRGIYALLRGLNRVYDVRETRGYIVTRGLCLMYTVAFLLLVVLTLALNVFGEAWIAELPGGFGAGVRFLRALVPQRFLVLTGLQLLIFTAMFRSLPNRKSSIWEAVPGALLASTGWLVFSDLFSLYLERFSGAAQIYGSLATVAMCMLWLYFCVSIVFYAGALNRYLQKVDFFGSGGEKSLDF